MRNNCDGWNSLLITRHSTYIIHSLYTVHSVQVYCRHEGVVGIIIEARRHVVGQKNVVDDNIPDNILAIIFGRDDIETTFPTICRRRQHSQRHFLKNVVQKWLKTPRRRREIGRFCLKMSSKMLSFCRRTTCCPKIPPDDIFRRPIVREVGPSRDNSDTNVKR